MPADIASVDELYLTGLHLDQYRHVTRCPTLLAGGCGRDAGDSRCNNAGVVAPTPREWAAPRVFPPRPSSG
ncbi:MAG: hypothetical protein U0736_16505 [Gemmataceae bacterium]